MKMLLILFCVFTSISVEAKTIYSEYEFTEYSYEKRENDELTKYEPIKLNKFYRNVETESEYLEEDVEQKYEYKRETDYKIETVRSNDLLKDSISEREIVIKSKDNYLSRKLFLQNFKDYGGLEIKEIKVMEGKKNIIEKVIGYPELSDEDINTGVKINKNSLEITLSTGCYVDSIELEIYYKSDKDIVFEYFPKNSSGLLPVKENLILEKNFDKVTIRTLKKDKFESFMNDNSLDLKDISYHYKTQKKLYKFYNRKREYYATLETTFLNGYTYDPLESIDAYKVYKRKILKDEPEEIWDDAEKVESPEPPIETTTTITSNNTTIPVKKPTSNLEKKKPSNTKNVFLSEKSNENNDEPPLEMLPDKTEKTKESIPCECESCEEKKSFSKLEKIGIVLMLLSIVVEILHLIYVNRDKE